MTFTFTIEDIKNFLSICSHIALAVIVINYVGSKILDKIGLNGPGGTWECPED